MTRNIKIALIKGDGIGIDVAEATKTLVDATLNILQIPPFNYLEINAGANYYIETGLDMEPDGEEMAEQCDAILMGAIGLPSVRTEEGTEIMPHLRLRERLVSCFIKSYTVNQIHVIIAPMTLMRWQLSHGKPLYTRQSATDRSRDGTA